MKKFFYTVIMAVVAITMLDSCLGKSVEDEYKDWREANEKWFQQQSESDQYTMMIAPWDPSAQVLMRWHNDTMQTRFNLKPLITSTVDVKYRLTCMTARLLTRLILKPRLPTASTVLRSMPMSRAG